MWEALVEGETLAATMFSVGGEVFSGGGAVWR